MIDRNVLRDFPDTVAAALESRGLDSTLVMQWHELDRERREKLASLEDLRRRRTAAARAFATVGAGNGAAAPGDAAEIKRSIGTASGEVEEVERQLAALELMLPNLPHESVPVGADEHANRVERTVGVPTCFDFTPKAHWDLGTQLGILDFERGVKLAGARFTVLAGAGARLERALINFMLDVHTREHGYMEMQPPYFANEDSLIGTGQLPKFKAELFRIEGTSLYPAPTAEVPLTNLHRDEILGSDELPLRYTAYTRCFRAEAGSYGRDVRGLLRQHEFDKVELVQITKPEQSWAALEQLTAHAETILQRLALPYRVVCLSTGDMGFSASKTYDLEVWLPAQDCYREISSCSNCTDFQARRASIRYKTSDGSKSQFVHSLNGSGLAVGRTLVAILENYQQADGSVAVPEALQPYFGSDRIEHR